jgi:putative ABC transport system permease protein
MRIIDILRLSLQSFRDNKLRTILTVLGIAIGIATIFFLVSLGFGLQKLSIEKLATAEALTTIEVTSGESQALKLDNKKVEEFEKIDEVEAVSPSVSFSAQGTGKSTTTDIALTGIKPKYSKIEEVTLVAGHSLSDSDEDKKEMVISKMGASLFGYENPENMLDKTTNLKIVIQSKENQKEKREVKLEDIKIVGISNDDKEAIGFVSLATLSPLDIQSYDLVKVKTTTQEKVSEVRDKIEAKGFMTSTVIDTVDQMFRIFRIIQTVLGIFGITALFVASIGMFNTMTISLLERTKEIGIMKSLGTTDRDVWRIFLTEAIIIGIGGGFIGVILGFVVGFIVNAGINSLAASVGGEAVSLFYYPFWFTLGIIIFSFLVGFLTGIYPAKRAAKLNPLEAIRYE